MTTSATAAAISVTGPASPKMHGGSRRMWKQFGLFVTAVAATSLTIAAANRHFDPLNFSGAGQAVAARHLEDGRNLTVHDPNFDFRGLRREHIRLMTRTPDVIAFAGSRFELARSDLFPDKTFYNAFVHSDYMEDLLAFTELLRANGRLPKTLVLSVRFATFLPVEARSDEEWKMFWPEYRAMADRLGLPKVPLSDNLPLAHWGQTFSMSLLKRQIALRLTADEMPGPTTDQTHPKFDVIRTDGSLVFSAAHQGSFTADAARAEALGRAKKVSERKAWPVDAERMAMLVPLLQFLRQNDVNVAIAITPHHPAYWNALVDKPYGKTLASIEAQVGKIATDNGAVLVGSFDPAKAGCEEKNFRDYIHLDEACLQKVFGKVPS
jgi:hypothetical protein